MSLPSNKYRGSTFKEYLENEPDELKEGPDGNVHCVPKTGPEHLERDDCWCDPELIQDSTNEGGCKAYLHREIQ